MNCKDRYEIELYLFTTKLIVFCLLDLLTTATNKLKNQPLLREVSGTAIVSGDIHGDIDALNKVIDLWKSEKTDNLILLGDYVDRGSHQLQVVEKIAETIVESKNFIPSRNYHTAKLQIRAIFRYVFKSTSCSKI